MHSYQDEHGRLPPAVVYDNDGEPLYSWRVLILPNLEQRELSQEFHLDEPWDSPLQCNISARIASRPPDKLRTEPSVNITSVPNSPFDSYGV